MKILFIHNDYFRFSGEEHAAEGLAGLLTQAGHQVDWYRRSSAELGNSFAQKIKAFGTGVYNPVAVREVLSKIEDVQPDIVQIQNLYPLISPAILKPIKKKGIPVVMRCPNYRLFCPNGLHLTPQGEVCESCLGRGKELNCIRKNCESNLLKSTGYALRNYVARTYWSLREQVDVFIVQSEFQKRKFISNGIPGSKISILPGLSPELTVPPTDLTEESKLVTFVGRASREKGILEFVQAASQLPNIRFAVAGNISAEVAHLPEQSPSNIKWMGFLNSKELDHLYQQSRIIVIPSKWYEGFPNVITRAMMHKRPVITSNIGAMQSIIDHEKNGLLTPPGNSAALQEAIKHLYSDIARCQQLGLNGHAKATRLYSNAALLEALLKTYEMAKGHTIA
ncbi:glycosyltransferase family 4 protein [Phaeodactylibacter xiamenensis]|uniref:glycosyltransferase family 4 protein n=1 Tax=Phaeodactylibacter xiamenensis TaxID=1524460 RepID=UPI0024A8DA30|nr:glycosyltransferase family 4 protein [Phaeodactylibacter xiamenensis]